MTGSQIGKTLWLAQGHPATNTAAGFAAMPWNKLESSQTFPLLAVSYASIDIEDTQTGFTIRAKGAATGDDTSFSFHKINGDGGQALAISLANAGGNGGNASIRIVKGTGDNNAPVAGDEVQYAMGYLHSYKPNPASPSANEGGVISFMVNAVPIIATIPAPATTTTTTTTTTP